ncbi:MFS transporter [Saccharopolyspora sp. NPDC003762]
MLPFGQLASSRGPEMAKPPPGTVTTGTVADTGAAKPRLNVKLSVSLAISNLGMNLVWGGVPAVLVPLQLQAIDPANKEMNLAWVITCGAVVSTFAQPVWGMLSDRTRSRFGRRSGHLIVGSLLGAGALLAIAMSSTVLMIAVAWCVVQATVTGANGVLLAVIPDRVPQAVRGLTASVLAFGTMTGTLGGQILASKLAGNGDLLPYAVVAAVLVVTACAFVLLNPDSSNIDEPRPPLSPSVLIRSMWVNPLKYPDFGWAFLGRLFLLLGYHMVIGYLIFILQDYVHLDKTEAVHSVPLISGAGLLTMLLSLTTSGYLSDRTGRRKPFVIASTLIIGIGLSIPLAFPSLTGMILFGAIAGFGFGCFLAVDVAMVTEVLPSKDDAAKDFGIANIASHAPQIAAPVLAGLTVVNLGGYQPLFLVALVFAVLGALCTLPIKSVR